MSKDTPVVVITGGSSGIGEATAMCLAERHPHSTIVIIGRDPAKLKMAQNKIQSIGSGCHSFSGDLTKQNFIESVFSDIKKNLKKIHYLVNNAGESRISMDLFKTSAEEWRNSLAIHLDSVFLCSKLAAELMIQKGIQGSIVNVSSIAWQIGTDRISYSAAKAGLVGLTRSLARSLAPLGIRVNAVSPGAIDTPATQNWDQTQKQDICKNIPLGRIGKASEVADVIAFLLSDESSYIVGQTINVNGGWYMQ